MNESKPKYPRLKIRTDGPMLRCAKIFLDDYEVKRVRSLSVQLHACDVTSVTMEIHCDVDAEIEVLKGLTNVTITQEERPRR